MGYPVFADCQDMLSDANSLNATHPAIAVNHTNRQSVLVRWGEGTTGGEVTVECADSASFSGTWIELTTIPWTTPNSQVQYDHDGPCQFIRTRISRAITGGTVTTKVQGFAG